MGLNNISKQVYLLVAFLLFVSITYLSSVNAESYYADISIDIDTAGFVTIDGVTNHPELLVENTEIYTSKKQSYWLLNITKEDIFSDFIYVLTLPEGSSINYIKSSGSIRIEENQGNLQVKGFGENESFSLSVQYQTKKLTENQFINFDLVFIVLIVGIMILIIILVSIFIKEKSKVKAQKINWYVKSY